jgi:hypothetical protein
MFDLKNALEQLVQRERTQAQVEGWILGVPGLIRAGKGRHDLGAPTCDPSMFRLY